MIKGVQRLGATAVAVLLILLFLLQPVSASASPVIYQLQIGASVPFGSISAATQEYVSIHNNSDQPVDVTGWCVSYASASDSTKTELGCLESADLRVHIMLDANSSFTLASSEFTLAHSGFVPDITFSSGISGSSGHIRLLDKNQLEIDRLGYGSASNPELSPATSPSLGLILQRASSSMQMLQLVDTDNNFLDFITAQLVSLPASGLFEEIVEVDVCPNIGGFQNELPPGYLYDENDDCRLDVCANIEELQVTVPEGYESLDGENCTLEPRENSVLIITELLPNAASADTGNEFIEIYNPNDSPVQLRGYLLQLGPAFTKSFVLPEQIIQPKNYTIFSDVMSGLVLPNSAGSLRLIAPAGNVVSIVDSYSDPKDNEAWAFIDGVWQYTNRPTPSQQNLPATVPDEELPASQAPSQCRADQERNPETNRCRLIQLASASLAPCKPGQERNPETNRCRAVAQTASSLVPCDEGQERNPETNRCRKIVGGEVAGIASVKDVEAGSAGANPRWILAAAAVAAALGYAVYEWRREVGSFATKIWAKLSWRSGAS